MDLENKLSDIPEGTCMIRQETSQKSVPVHSIESEISSTLANDPVMLEILPMFLENLAQQVGSIASLLEQNNLAQLRSVIHQIKGAGGSYGFACLTDSAALAEASIKQSEPLTLIQAKVDSMLRLIRRIRGYNRAQEKSL